MDCGTGPVSQAADAKELMQQNARAVAYTLEAGIVFHSLFVGIALGTSREASYVKGLAIALIFHQVCALCRPDRNECRHGWLARASRLMVA